MVRIAFFLLAVLTASPLQAAQGSYLVQKLDENVYAAIARPGGRSSTNAFFVAAGNQVIAGGAHMTREAIDDLWSAIAETTNKPVRYFVLTHHHAGFSHIDTAFPAEVTLVLAGETWKSLDQELRKPTASLLLFSDGMTLKSPGAPTVVLSSIGRGHTDGDTMVFFPESKSAYVGDLLYVQSVGYMGDGHMREWLQSLDVLAGLELSRIIPGFGPPVGMREVDAFRDFFRDFLSAILTRIEEGESAETIKQTFTLPKYRDWSGYNQLLRDNAVRAWKQLKSDLSEE